MAGAGDADGVEFLARADVENLRAVFAQRGRGVLRLDEHSRVLGAGGFHLGEHGGGIESVVAGADLGERFVRTKSAARAAADVVEAKQCALGAGQGLEDLLHREVGRKRGRHGTGNMEREAAGGKKRGS
jgi:hypothetical protein